MAPRRLRRTLPAALEEVDAVCRVARFLMSAAGRDDDLFATELLLRESLTNAVVHGCASDRTKRVRCEIRLGRRGLGLTVADDGPGFDWGERLGAEADPRCESGRGIFLCRAYAARLRFNAAGNRLSLYRPWTQGRNEP